MTVARTQDRMSHDVFLPAEIVELRARARASVAKHVAPVAREIGSREESVDSFPWDAFRGLASDGLFGIPFGDPYGNLEHPMLGVCTVAEEIAYESSSLAGVYDGQCILVPATLAHATPAMRDRLVPDLVSGQQAFAFATTEPETSSDLTAT